MIGAAEISLGRLGAAGTKDYLTRQLSRPSRYWDSIRIGALVGLGKLEDPALVAALRLATSTRSTSRKCAPQPSPAGRPRLPTTRSSPSACACSRATATARSAKTPSSASGRCHRESDIALLRELSTDPDPTVAEFARAAIEETEGFTKK